MDDINWIDADILAETIKTDDDDNNKSDMLIVDVRDDDYGSLSIKNSINVPSTTFDDDNTKLNLLKYIKEKNKKVIIFHCMESQIRGPTCAISFKTYIDKTTNGEDITIQVLSGGFSRWKTLFCNDDKLVTKRSD